MPADGEVLDAWVTRARQWIAANRKRTGPKTSGDADTEAKARIRWRLARAQLAELELQQRRGAVHSRSECERDFVARLQELRAAFAQLPDMLARRLYQAPSPEAIKVQVEEELRRCFEALARGHDDVGAA